MVITGTGMIGAEKFTKKKIPFQILGDADSPGNIRNAIHSSFQLVNGI